MGTREEVAAMRRAIALSAFGLGATSPNPPVGCVVLDVEGNVVGEGYHRRKGEAHAEVHALTAAGERASGGTAVVTLEPCNHQGRTPPCRQALIDAGVARVVIALIDPTSREEGGAVRLQAAGVDVELGVLEDEARFVIGPWLSALKSGIPYVHWVYVADDDATLDVDRIAARFRSEVDAVLTTDGGLEEGVPNSHSPDVFSLPMTVGAAPAAVLTDMFSRGVRTLLLSGRSKLANAMADEGLVERISCHIPRQPASVGPTTSGRHHDVPEGFEVTGVTLADKYVRLNLSKISPDEGLRPARFT